MKTMGEMLMPCRHPRVEIIRNGNGDELGRLCKLCVNILSGVANCYGCEREGADIRKRVADRFYCDDACQRSGEVKWRKAQEAKRKAPPTAQQTEWSWARKDKRS